MMTREQFLAACARVWDDRQQGRLTGPETLVVMTAILAGYDPYRGAI